MSTSTIARWIEVRGAYGRTYKSMKSAQIDFLAGLDFQMTDTGQYLSIRDVENDPSIRIILRYSQDRKTGTLL